MHAEAPRGLSRSNRSAAASRLAAGLTLAAGIAAATAAAAAPAATAPVPATALERWPSAAFRVDRTAGGSVHVARADTPVCTGAQDARDAAERFLAANGRALGLPDDLGQLTVTLEQESLAGRHVRYTQAVDGVPVWRSALAVHLDRSSCVVQADRSWILAGPVTGGFALAESDAVARAIEGLKDARWTDKRGMRPDEAALAAIAVAGTPSVSRVLYSEDEGKVGRRAWLVALETSAPHGHWEVVVDGEDGSVLGTRDLARYSVDGSGQVYPKSNACIVMMDPTLRDAADADTAVPAAAYGSVTLLTLDNAVGGLYSLTGPYVRIQDTPGEAPAIAPPTSATPSFVFTRSPDGFEPVMEYYYIDLTERYIQSLGFTSIMNRRIDVDSHGLGGADNSHYVGTPAGMGRIAYGDGGVDDGEDADVVFHEYGHAIQDNQVPGWGGTCEGGAMGEGFGDYMAGTMHSAYGYVNACIAMWDATAYDPTPPPMGPCLRRIDCTTPGGNCDRASYVWAGGCTEVHADGEIWSAALWSLHGTIGRDAFNRILLESQFSVPTSGRFRDAALALFDADQRLNGCANCSAICDVMVARGFILNSDCPGPRAIVAGHSIDDSAPRGDGDRTAEPGEDIVMPVTLQNVGTLNLTAVTSTLTSDQPGYITITNGTAFGQVNWPDIAIGASQLSLVPHFAWSVDPSTPCGQIVNFTVNVQTAQGTTMDGFPETIGRRLPPTTVTHTGPAVAIPDADPVGAISTIVTALPGTITNIAVRVPITHTWVGDLIVTLISPRGTRVPLLNRPGEPAAASGCADDNMNVTFDDLSPTTGLMLEAYCMGTNPWYASDAQPFNPAMPLSSLVGEPIAGTWTLEVSDNAAMDIGTIDAWALLFNSGFSCAAGGGCASMSPVTNLRAVKRGATNRLTWDLGLDPCRASYKVYRSSVSGMKPTTRPGTWPVDPLFADVTSTDIDATSTNEAFDWAPAGTIEYFKVVDVGTDGTDGPAGSFGG